MNFKRLFVSLFMGVSILFAGSLLSCDNASNSGSNDGNGSNGNNQEPGISIGLELKNSDSGIELSWGNLPEDIAQLEIYTSEGRFSGNRRFIICDLDAIKSVKDEYVDAGKSYKYKIEAYDEKEHFIGKTEWITIEAAGGKGERQFNVEAVSNGIKISGEAHTEGSLFCLWKNKKGTEIVEYYDFYEPAGYFEFIDEFVEAGEEYTYYLEECIRTEDVLYYYPDCKIKTIKAKNGSGSVLKKHPVFTYDDNTRSVIYQEDAEFLIDVDDWGIDYYYQQQGKESDCIFSLGSYNEIGERVFISYAFPDGEWTFDYCDIFFYFDDYQYSYQGAESTDKNSSKDFLNKITISSDNLLKLEANPTKDGIKFTWKNIPEDTECLDIYEIDEEDESRSVFRINNINKIASVTDKYVTKDVEYSYYIVALDEDNNTILESSPVKIKATGGVGPVPLVLEATSEGIHITGTRQKAHSYLRIEKTYEDSQMYSLHINETDGQNIDFIDPFVATGKQYVYSLVESIEEEVSADLYEYPRGIRNTITAVGGSGELEIINSPNITYNNSSGEITFSTKPQIPGEFEDWTIDFNYESEEYGFETLFTYSSTDTSLKKELEHVNPDLYIFSNYIVYVNAQDFWCSRTIEGYDTLNSIPGEMDLSE